MKTINVEITGVAPLLQHRFATEEHGENTSKSKKKVYDPKVEAEKCLYKNAKGEIYQPAEHIYQSMVRAAVDFKFEKKRTYKDVITSGIIVQPEEIPLIFEGQYEIDARSYTCGCMLNQDVTQRRNLNNNDDISHLFSKVYL